MITKTKYKRLDGNGMRRFTVNQDVTLEILTSSTEHEGKERTFLANGSFYGEPVLASIQRKTKSGSWESYGEGEGIMVYDQENKSQGFWLIPMRYIEDYQDESEKATESLPDNEKSESTQLISKASTFMDQKVFGFTYKQVLFITALIIIAKKL